MKKILFLLMVSAISFGGCGGGDEDGASSSDSDTGTSSGSGDGKAPSISTVYSGSTKVETSGTKLAVNATVKVTFTEAMNVDSITASTFKLETGGNAVDGSISADSSKTAFTFTPTAELSPLGTYKITIVGGSGGVKDSSGALMASSASYEFTTSCSASDYFTQDSSGCYTWRNTSNQSNESGATVKAAAITIDESDSDVVKLAFSTTNSTMAGVGGFQTIPMLYRKISGDFDVQMTVKNVTIYNSASTSVGLHVVSDLDALNPVVALYCKFIPTGGCIVTASLSGPSTEAEDNSFGLGSGPLLNVAANHTVRVVRSGKTLSCYCKGSGSSSFTQIGTDSTVSALPTELILGIAGESRTTSGDAVLLLDDFLFNSGTPTDISLPEN